MMDDGRGGMSVWTTRVGRGTVNRASLVPINLAPHGETNALDHAQTSLRLTSSAALAGLLLLAGCGATAGTPTP